MTSAPRRTASGRRAHVLLVTPHYFPSIGGVERHVHEVARRLGGLGFETTVLTTDAEGTLPRHEQADGFSIRRVRAWNGPSDLRFAPAIARAVARSGSDLIHVQSYHTFVAPLAMLAAKRAGIPYVLTFHGGGHASRMRHGLRQRQLQALRPLLARAARLVAVAEFEIGLYRRWLRLPAGRFVLIPNGVDVQPPTGGSADRDGAVIASVGRLERYKGHHRAIAAMPHVLVEEPQARLSIVGSGAYEDALRALASTLRIEDRVEIRAVAGDDPQAMARTLSGTRLVVLLSGLETHPIAALESLAAGRRVLVADTSGLAELAAHHDGVSKIPLESTPSQVAQAMLDELRRPDTPRPPQLPSWDDCASSLANLYREVLEGSSCAS
jgi:glycosyltransferase involved in cell wall biosynthesis